MADLLRSKTPAAATDDRVRRAPRLPVVSLGLSLGLFFVITYVLCVAYDLIFPAHTMATIWLRLLPGFVWLSWESFALGLIESFAYGWYVALIFAPLFNYFALKFER